MDRFKKVCAVIFRGSKRLVWILIGIFISLYNVYTEGVIFTTFETRDVPTSLDLFMRMDAFWENLEKKEFDRKCDRGPNEEVY
jgi:hypothetical protein